MTPSSLNGASLTGRPQLSTLPEVLTTREGAAFLRCSKAHFCHLLNGVVAGVPRLPYLQLGRRRLVRKVVLIEWIKQVEGRSRLTEKETC
jgi:hypothetical protein